jgi:hypothetical protein
MRQKAPWLLKTWAKVNASPRGRHAVNLMILILSLVASYVLFGENLRAFFWLDDDHEILRFVGNGHQSIFNFFDLMRTTEVWQFGNSVRYRPGYYSMYILECLAWGARPQLWYLSRIFMCGIFIFSIFRLIKNFFGATLAAAFLIFAFSFDYWIDVWCRLGPGESYVALGLGIYFIGFLRAINRSKVDWASGISLTLGVLIAAGAKENMVILIFPQIYLTFVLWRRNAFTSVVPTLLISTFYILGIVSAVVATILKSKVDYNQNPVTLSARLKIFDNFFSLFDAQLVSIALAMGLIYFLIAKAWRSTRNIQNAEVFVIQLASSFFLLASQFGFYNGVWPTGIRYDFPGMLVRPLIYLFTARLTIKILSQTVFQWHRVTAHFPTASIALSSITLITVCTLNFKGIENIREGALRNVQRTTETHFKLEAIREKVSKDESIPIVFESFRAQKDYEAIVSLKVFLGALGVRNPIGIRIHGYDQAPLAPAEKALAHSISSWAKDGYPVQTIKGRCWSVDLSGDSNENCTKIVRF